LVVKAGRTFDPRDTGGPFEFLLTDNNIGVSAALPITLTPAPDLAVTRVTAPARAQERPVIDATWQAAHPGAGTAPGTWTDLVYLQKVGDPTAPQVALGSFTYTGPLESGKSYTRSEAVRLPSQINDQFRIVVTTNSDGTLFENGATANNSRAATTE